MDYIERYPNSYRIDEATNILSICIFKQNYKGAIESIEKVKPNEKLNMVYQK